MAISLIRLREHNVIKLQTPQGFVQFAFKPGEADKANLKADVHERQVIASITERLGRPPTQTELLDGKVAAATDSRSIFEKVADQQFRPIKNGEPTIYDEMLADADAKVERERYSKMTPAEQQREDVAKLIAKKEAEADANASHTERLEKYAPKIEKLKKMQNALNWSLEADEKDRQMVSQALQILETPRADLRPVTGLLTEIESREHQRKVIKLAELEQKKEALANQQAALAEQQAALADGGFADASQ